MGFLIDDLPQYQPTPVTPAPQSYADQVAASTARANQPVSQFQDQLNQGVKSESNLMGPSSDPSNPQSDALGSRANQIYQSQVNQVNRSALPQAVNRQNQLQTQNLDYLSASYANTQSRAMLAWQQTAYQRQAAISQEMIKRELYGSLFKGVGAVGGMFLAKGLHNVNNPSASEVSPGGGFSSNGVGSFDAPSPGSSVPNSYSSANLGTIGGN